jgi:hypothetical protein
MGKLVNKLNNRSTQSTKETRARCFFSIVPAENETILFDKIK